MREQTRRCWCVINHPQTPAKRAEVGASLAYARRIGDPSAVLLCLAMLIGPCPAWPTPQTTKETKKQTDVDELLRTLAGRAAPDEPMDKETLRMHVARQVTCPINKTVLDLKNSVVIQGGSPFNGTAVISSQAWDELGADLLDRFAEEGVMPKIVDARLLDWTIRPMDYEELGVYRDVLDKFAGDEAFARWWRQPVPVGCLRPRQRPPRVRPAQPVPRRRNRGHAARVGRTAPGHHGPRSGPPVRAVRQAHQPGPVHRTADLRCVVVPLNHLERAPSPTSELEPGSGLEPPLTA
ncbi:hypothetical protein GCM10010191_89510 [Actinomadura vinacea]|uniref:Uncharacterized protein n=1 Tax=Actinomadura vinacea TaxID=115336 RepID=A0ABP5XK77_9ACTN